MKKNSLQSYMVRFRTKTALKTMNQIPIITAQIVESSRRALYYIATKSRKKPTFLKISSRICHFRLLDEKKSEVGTYSAMYRSEKTKKPLYAVISGFSFQVPTRIVDPTSRINEFPIVRPTTIGTFSDFAEKYSARLL